MIIEIIEENGIKLIRNSAINNNTFMNIIDIRLEMMQRMKLYRSSQNELMKIEILKEYSLLEKMITFIN